MLKLTNYQRYAILDSLFQFLERADEEQQPENFPLPLDEWRAQIAAAREVLELLDPSQLAPVLAPSPFCPN